MGTEEDGKGTCSSSSCTPKYSELVALSEGEGGATDIEMAGAADEDGSSGSSKEKLGTLATGR